MAQRVTHLPAMREARVQSLGWEDPLEKEMATHSSILSIFSIKYTILASRQGSLLSSLLDLLPVPASVSRHPVSS